MKVRMLRTRTGSPDGLTVELYKAGEVYLLPPPLAEVFLSTGDAEEDKELVLETKIELQAHAPAPKQKRRRQ